MTKSIADIRSKLQSILTEADETPKKKKSPKKSAKKSAPPKAKRKRSPMPKLEDPASKGEVSAPKPEARPPTNTQAPPGQAVGRAALRGGATDPESAAHMRNLIQNVTPDENDLTGDQQGRDLEAPQPDPTNGVEPTPPRPPENLPAVISRAVTSTEGGAASGWQPRWMQIKQTPGYFQNAIRSLGRRIFGGFTETPVSDIYVMANPFAGTQHDVDMMSRWIRRHGAHDDEMMFDFNDIMPGYEAEGSLWNVEGYTFLLVRDHAGQYIYSWPGGRGINVGGGGAQPLQLESKTKALVRVLVG